jgi:hypothetical protein
MPIPLELRDIIKKNKGHKKIENIHLIEKFQQWINRFDKNRLYADPQMRWLFDRYVTEKEVTACAKQDLYDDEDETEETLC